MRVANGYNSPKGAVEGVREEVIVLRFWRYFRLGLLIFVLIGLGFYLGVTTPWGRIFGRAPTYAAEVKEGDPIVAAIYRFRAERGIWPEYLEDLVPGYLAKGVSARWYYTVTSEGPSLAVDAGDVHTHVGYLFDGERPGWRVFGGVEELRVLREDAGAAATRAAGVSGEERVANELRELDRRIAREPGMMEHRREKAGVLMGLNREGEVREVIEKAAGDFPDHYWPRLARVELENSAGAREGFAEWVRRRPTFTGYYYLALLYRGAHEDAAALLAMREGLKQAVEVGAEDPDILAFYLWDMGRYALERGDYALVVAVADAWEKLSAAHEVKEDSYLALRAAANLALHHEGAAERDLTLLESLKTRTWAQHVDGLRAAVGRKEWGFRYEPGAVPGGFEVFPLPQ